MKALIKIVSLSIIFFCSLFISEHSIAQKSAKNHKNYKKNSKNFYAKRYSKNYIKADKQCDRLREKKFKRKNKKIAKATKKKKSKPVALAEVDINEAPPPSPKPKPEEDPKPDLASMNLDEKHQVEDEVLIKNNLPAPTSEKHEQIRKEIEKHLANFENEKPLKLAPLYFVTGQDEFAFVDMDPFLIAVEYALQGKHVLIEGHTDHVGNFEANVALSIKRVERIRDLMVQMGVEDEKISVVGYGEEKSSNSSESVAKQEERRVDFTVF